MVSHINSNVKGREAFRPFAPSVLAEEASSWFEGIAPYSPGEPGRWGLQGEVHIWRVRYAAGAARVRCPLSGGMSAFRGG